ncbi:MAG: hypothetical protein WCF31_07060 [Candidatus Deferrimicrobiaceae bacterium]
MDIALTTLPTSDTAKYVFTCIRSSGPAILLAFSQILVRSVCRCSSDGRRKGYARKVFPASIPGMGVFGPEPRLARIFSDKDRLLVDYLMDEVISHQPSEVRDFLSVTAMLDRFCAPLCDMLLADEGKGEYRRGLLTRLERQNLFLIPLDRERHWYRYHHLFRNFLEQHLAQRMPRDRAVRLKRLAGK